MVCLSADVLWMVTQLCFVSSVSLCSDRTKELLTDGSTIAFRHPGHKLLCLVATDCCFALSFVAMKQRICSLDVWDRC